MKYAILLLFLFLSACSKPDPAPELKDPIFGDLNAELALVTAALETEKGNLKKNEEELLAVVPQTGQIKYAQKRVDESKAKIVKLDQQKQYLELKVEARKKVARRTYLEAYHKKENWPNPTEWQNYELEKKLRSAKKTWDVKERMKEAGVGLDITQKAEGGHSEPPSGGH